MPAPSARQPAPASTSARLGPCDVLPLPAATPPVGVGPSGVGWPGRLAVVGCSDGVVGRADDVGGVYRDGFDAEGGGSFGRGNQSGGGVFGPNARSGLFSVGPLLDGSPPDGGGLPALPWSAPPGAVPVAGSLGVTVCVGESVGRSLRVDGMVDGDGSELDGVGDALALCVGSVVSEDVAVGLVLAIAIGVAMPASASPAERAAAWRVRLTHGAMDDLS